MFSHSWISVPLLAPLSAHVPLLYTCFDVPSADFSPSLTKKFYVCSLSKFEIHPEITNWAHERSHKHTCNSGSKCSQYWCHLRRLLLTSCCVHMTILHFVCSQWGTVSELFVIIPRMYLFILIHFYIFSGLPFSQYCFFLVFVTYLINKYAGRTCICIVWRLTFFLIVVTLEVIRYVNILENTEDESCKQCLLRLLCK